jgi:hypothetical protein
MELVRLLYRGNSLFYREHAHGKNTVDLPFAANEGF